MSKISHYLRRIAGYLTKIRRNFDKIQLFRSRILFLGQALINTNMKYVIKLILVLFIANIVSAQDKTHWVEIGKGTYEYGFIYPYKVKFYVPYGVRNIAEIKQGLVPMKFELDWLLINYPQTKVQKLFSKQLEKHYASTGSFKLSNNLIKSFLNKLPAVNKHDKWTFTYYPDEGSRLFITDKKIHHLVGAELNRALLQSWLNKNPVLTANLFNRLLKVQ
ncbi:hypothetical protein MNBD_GAMMA01-536 [hydrothermal vent metagenome]|uniref:Chalcone isomerase domain-containing protein n=1 Tax=hydrothermal vent metagenome TaxID=652676 RepID=A0A3B0V0T6_9ZZZZ